jgi:GT2 family glycosyltransferase
VVLRRSAYDSTPGWRASLFFYWEGLDLAYALHSSGWQVVHAGHLAILHNVSPERRVQWGQGRFYYYARNRVAIEWDYFGLLPAAKFAAWYLVLGVRRRHAGAALRGLRDAFGVHAEDVDRRMPADAKVRVRALMPARRDAARIAVRKLRRSHHG